MSPKTAVSPQAAGTSRFDSRVVLGLVCVSIVLALLPLIAFKPGLPATLKADEPAYYLAALSLAFDRDLLCEPHDLQRLFEEYPYLPARNVILASDDGWRTLFYGKPYLYSLFAAPFAAIWKANGLVFFNMLLLVAMIWMGFLYLRRFNTDAHAALFATGFFVCSTSVPYVFWLHPELFNMFSAMGCLFFALHRLPEPGGLQRGHLHRLAARLFSSRTGLWWSGALLAIGTYNKPMLAAVGLPVVIDLLWRRRFRGLAAWLASAALTIALAAGLSAALTGHPTAYLGVARAGLPIDSPHEPPIEPVPITVDSEELSKETAGWWWIFRLPDIKLAELLEDGHYFFFGRHTGLLLYQPFAILALLLFLGFEWRSRLRWTIVGSAALIALFFLIFIPFNWHGGGGFIGNRYFIMVYPIFLFLVTRIRPPWVMAVGFASAGLFLGPLLLSPFGTVVPSPTLQAHVRNLPFQQLPLELSLREIPGYDSAVEQEIWFLGRKDQFRAVEGGELWFAGGEESEVWMRSAHPIKELQFRIRMPESVHAVDLTLSDVHTRVEAPSGGLDETPRIRLSITEPTRVRMERHPEEYWRLIPIYVYQLRVHTEHGELPRWRRGAGPSFYLGAALTLEARRFGDSADSSALNTDPSLAIGDEVKGLRNSFRHRGGQDTILAGRTTETYVTGRATQPDGYLDHRMPRYFWSGVEASKETTSHVP